MRAIQILILSLIICIDPASSNALMRGTLMDPGTPMKAGPPDNLNEDQQGPHKEMTLVSGKAPSHQLNFNGIGGSAKGFQSKKPSGTGGYGMNFGGAGGNGMSFSGSGGKGKGMKGSHEMSFSESAGGQGQGMHGGQGMSFGGSGGQGMSFSSSGGKGKGSHGMSSSGSAGGQGQGMYGGHGMSFGGSGGQGMSFSNSGGKGKGSHGMSSSGSAGGQGQGMQGGHGMSFGGSGGQGMSFSGSGGKGKGMKGSHEMTFSGSAGGQGQGMHGGQGMSFGGSGGQGMSFSSSGGKGKKSHGMSSSGSAGGQGQGMQGGHGMSFGGSGGQGMSFSGSGGKGKGMKGSHEMSFSGSAGGQGQGMHGGSMSFGGSGGQGMSFSSSGGKGKGKGSHEMSFSGSAGGHGQGQGYGMSLGGSGGHGMSFGSSGGKGKGKGSLEMSFSGSAGGHGQGQGYGVSIGGSGGHGMSFGGSGGQGMSSSSSGGKGKGMKGSHEMSFSGSAGGQGQGMQGGHGMSFGGSKGQGMSFSSSGGKGKGMKGSHEMSLGGSGGHGMSFGSSGGKGKGKGSHEMSFGGSTGGNKGKGSGGSKGKGKDHGSHEVPHTPPPTHPPPTHQPQKSDGSCQTQKLLDLVLVIDESGSIGFSNFQKVQKFAGQLIDSFDVDSGQVKVATVRYSGIHNKGVFVLHHFDDLHTAVEIKHKIMNMNYAAGATATGHTNDGVKPAGPAKALTKSGALVFAVGIKGASKQELHDIAQDPKRIIEIQNFSNLGTQIRDQISKTVCKEAEKAPQPPPAPGKCPTSKLLDMVLVVDESGSIGENNYKKMKKFIGDLVDTFDVDSGQVQIATMRYSGIHNKGIHIVHQLKDFKKGSSIKKAVLGMPYSAGATATGKALQVCAAEVFQPSQGLRMNALKVVVVFTDGNTNDGPMPGGPAKALAKNGAIIFAVGIKGASHSELLSIAQNPKRVIEIDDFSKLGDQIKNSISNTVCEEAEKEPPPTLPPPHPPSTMPPPPPPPPTTMPPPPPPPPTTMPPPPPLPPTTMPPPPPPPPTTMPPPPPPPPTTMPPPPPPPPPTTMPPPPPKHTTKAPKPTTPTTPVQKPESCQTHKLLDIVFVVDESGSIGLPNFKKVQKFVGQLIDSFDVDSGQVKVATVRYSGIHNKGVFVLHHFDDLHTAAEIKQKIMNMNYAAGLTATGQALIKTRTDVLQVAHGMRSNALQVVVVITDGDTNNGVKPAEPAKELTKAGALVFAVGIKGASKQELHDIAQDPKRVIEIQKFSKLGTQIRDQISKTVCKEAEKAPQPPPAPGKCPTSKLLDMVLVVDESGSIGENNYKKMKKFIGDLVDTFDVDSGQVQIATMRYSGIHNKGIHIVHQLKDFKKGLSIKKAVLGMPYSAGATATGKALQVCRAEVFQPSEGLRPKALKVVVVFTDGNTNDGPMPGGPAKALAKEGAIIFAVGIKGASHSELLSIAQNPKRVIEIDNFNKLGDQIKNSISNTVCEEAEKEPPISKAGELFLQYLMPLASDDAPQTTIAPPPPPPSLPPKPASPPPPPPPPPPSVPSEPASVPPPPPPPPPSLSPKPASPPPPPPPPPPSVPSEPASVPPPPPPPPPSLPPKPASPPPPPPPPPPSVPSEPASVPPPPPPPPPSLPPKPASPPPPPPPPPPSVPSEPASVPPPPPPPPPSLPPKPASPPPPPPPPPPPVPSEPASVPPPPPPPPPSLPPKPASPPPPPPPPPPSVPSEPASVPPPPPPPPPSLPPKPASPPPPPPPPPPSVPSEPASVPPPPPPSLPPKPASLPPPSVPPPPPPPPPTPAKQPDIPPSTTKQPPPPPAPAPASTPGPVVTQPPPPPPPPTTEAPAPSTIPPRECNDFLEQCAKLAPVCSDHNADVHEHLHKRIRRSLDMLETSSESAEYEEFYDYYEEDEYGDYGFPCHVHHPGCRHKHKPRCSRPRPPPKSCENCDEFKKNAQRLVRLLCPMTCNVCDANTGKQMHKVAKFLKAAFEQ